MKILITGGAGFIGSNLARYILDKVPSAKVRVIDDLSTGRRENLNGLKVELFEASILDYDTLREAVRGVDSIPKCSEGLGCDLNDRKMLQFQPSKFKNR